MGARHQRLSTKGSGVALVVLVMVVAVPSTLFSSHQATAFVLPSQCSLKPAAAASLLILRSSPQEGLVMPEDDDDEYNEENLDNIVTSPDERRRTTRRDMIATSWSSSSSSGRQQQQRGASVALSEEIRGGNAPNSPAAAAYGGKKHGAETVGKFSVRSTNYRSRTTTSETSTNPNSRRVPNPEVNFGSAATPPAFGRRTTQQVPPPAAKYYNKNPTTSTNTAAAASRFRALSDEVVRGGTVPNSPAAAAYGQKSRPSQEFPVRSTNYQTAAEVQDDAASRHQRNRVPSPEVNFGSVAKSPAAATTYEQTRRQKIQARSTNYHQVPDNKSTTATSRFRALSDEVVRGGMAPNSPAAAAFGGKRHYSVDPVTGGKAFPVRSTKYTSKTNISETPSSSSSAAFRNRVPSPEVNFGSAADSPVTNYEEKRRGEKRQIWREE